jgi:hypothetical protein
MTNPSEPGEYTPTLMATAPSKAQPSAPAPPMGEFTRMFPAPPPGILPHQPDPEENPTGEFTRLVRVRGVLPPTPPEIPDQTSEGEFTKMIRVASMKSRPPAGEFNPVSSLRNGSGSAERGRFFEPPAGSAQSSPSAVAPLLSHIASDPNRDGLLTRMFQRGDIDRGFHGPFSDEASNGISATGVFSTPSPQAPFINPRPHSPGDYTRLVSMTPQLTLGNPREAANCVVTPPPANDRPSHGVGSAVPSAGPGRSYLSLTLGTICLLQLAILLVVLFALKN